MCGFCGYVNYEQKIENDKIISKMNETLFKRGPNEQHIYIHKQLALAHSRLSIIDVKNGVQPMQIEKDHTLYTIIYNGELYNTKEVRQNLLEKGYTFQTSCDTEVVLTAFIEYQEKCLALLNGIFSFVIYNQKENSLFMARDRLGIKPLFYSLQPRSFIFGSEIKAILAHPDVEPILTQEGLLEMIALGPAHTPGKTYFKNIYELKAGHYAIFKNRKFLAKRYWDLEKQEFHDTEEQAILKIHDLVTDACTRQLVSDVPICSMLSGGIDSSILTKIAHDHLPNLHTYSIDYLGNDQDFKANIYQQTKDSDFVKIMQRYLNTHHHTVQISQNELFEELENAMIARDMPGMADIDSSMLAFCKEISKDFKVCLSGECSDEIFGGYPWFYRKHLLEHDGFPWALSENLRTKLLKKPLQVKEYVQESITNTLKEMKPSETKDSMERKFEQINYLTIKWFMNTLVERTDRMSMLTSLEVRVPFADHRIFEYVYSIPAKLKLGLHKSDTPIEKYLLRKAFEGEIPEEILYRKKSPYPKTYDPHYLNLVENKVTQILQKEDSYLANLLDVSYIQTLIKNHGEGLTENLFGQLMTYPQLLAYIYQIHMWFERYQPKIEM